MLFVDVQIQKKDQDVVDSPLILCIIMFQVSRIPGFQNEIHTFQIYCLGHTCISLIAVSALCSQRPCSLFLSIWTQKSANHQYFAGVYRSLYTPVSAQDMINRKYSSILDYKKNLNQKIIIFLGEK